MSQSEAAALHRHQEEVETDKPNKHKSNKSTKISSLSSLDCKKNNKNKNKNNTRQVLKQNTGTTVLERSVE